MRIIFKVLFFVSFSSVLFAQNAPPTSMQDVDFSLVSWERGQVLVRFADQLSPSLNVAKSQTKISPVDQILADYQG
ncbi:MAG: hypothetical protein QNK59_02105, partial [Flavobacteriales bacterium]